MKLLPCPTERIVVDILFAPLEPPSTSVHSVLHSPVLVCRVCINKLSRLLLSSHWILPMSGTHRRKEWGQDTYSMPGLWAGFFGHSFYLNTLSYFSFAYLFRTRVSQWLPPAPRPGMLHFLFLVSLNSVYNFVNSPFIKLSLIIWFQFIGLWKKYFVKSVILMGSYWK